MIKKIILSLMLLSLVSAGAFAGDFHLFLGAHAGSPTTIGGHVGVDWAPKNGFGVEAFALGGVLPVPGVTISCAMSRFGVVYTFSPADWFDLRLSAGYENMDFKGEFWWGGEEQVDKMTGGYIRIAPLFKAWFLNIHPSIALNSLNGEMGVDGGLTIGIQL